MIDKFRETGWVLDGELNGRPSELNDKKLLGVYVCLYAAECIKIIGQVGARGRYPTPV
jgi:hypothetical protein